MRTNELGRARDGHHVRVNHLNCSPGAWASRLVLASLHGVAAGLSQSPHQKSIATPPHYFPSPSHPTTKSLPFTISLSLSPPPTHTHRHRYRLTPHNVSGVIEKDTGDAAGDLGFYLMTLRKLATCSPSQANTDECFLALEPVIRQFIVETDGRCKDLDTPCVGVEVVSGLVVVVWWVGGSG